MRPRAADQRQRNDGVHPRRGPQPPGAQRRPRARGQRERFVRRQAQVRQGEIRLAARRQENAIDLENGDDVTLLHQREFS